jgi:hypothetical protein
MGILDYEFGGGGIVPTDTLGQWRVNLPSKPGYKPPETPTLRPGKPDIGLEETPELDVGSSGYIEQPDDGFTDVTDRPSYWGNTPKPFTDDQRFMLIGLVVLGGIFGFVKK